MLEIHKGRAPQMGRPWAGGAAGCTETAFPRITRPRLCLVHVELAGQRLHLLGLLPQAGLQAGSPAVEALVMFDSIGTPKGVHMAALQTQGSCHLDGPSRPRADGTPAGRPAPLPELCLLGSFLGHTMPLPPPQPPPSHAFQNTLAWYRFSCSAASGPGCRARMDLSSKYSRSFSCSI